MARRWHYKRSLASRVIVLTTMAVGLSVALVAVAVFITVRMQMMSSLDHSLLSRAGKAVKSPTLSVATASRVPSWMLGAADIRIGFISADGQVVTADSWPGISLGQPELEVAEGQLDHVTRTVRADDGVRYRVATVDAGDGQALVIAQSMASQDETLARLAVVMGVLGVLGMLLAALAGWGVARNGLRPVRRLTADVERIARTEDLTPLPVEGDDEIARLARAFNQMLTAVAASRDRQRQLVADAGHELRTPLTSLRTNLELLSQADAGGGLPDSARAELLDDVRAQTEELGNLVGDLVELARDEPMTLVLEQLDLSEVVEQALTRVRRRAPGIDFETSLSPWWLEGDPAALERAVANLLDNAAKWSPPGGTIRVALRDGVLTVDDEGPGISDQDLPHVFDRFYRSQESRAMPGSGLGLSIVARVAERHAGTASATRSPYGGARLILALPGQAVPPAPPLRAEAATVPGRGAGARPSTSTPRTLPRPSNAP